MCAVVLVSTWVLRIQTQALTTASPYLLKKYFIQAADYHFQPSLIGLVVRCFTESITPLFCGAGHQARHSIVYSIYYSIV